MLDQVKERLQESGVDVTNSLVYFMGNERLYKKYFLRFLTEPSFPKLFSSIEAESREEARIAAHSLKSITATLGFSHLHRIVKDQESAFKEGRWVDGVKLTPQIKAEYERICALIESVRKDLE